MKYMLFASVLLSGQNTCFLPQCCYLDEIHAFCLSVVTVVAVVWSQDGVNWLGFLNKYQLHGILCDDMGLGKTLQSLCLLATDHQLQDALYEVGVTDHHLQDVLYEVGVTDHQLQDVLYEVGVTDHQLQDTLYEVGVTDHQDTLYEVGVTDHQDRWYKVGVSGTVCEVCISGTVCEVVVSDTDCVRWVSVTL